MYCGVLVLCRFEVLMNQAADRAVRVRANRTKGRVTERYLIESTNITELGCIGESLACLQSPAASATEFTAAGTPQGIRAAEACGQQGTKALSYEVLKRGALWPPLVDTRHRESYLSTNRFAELFGMKFQAFQLLPVWRQIQLKHRFDLF